MQNLARTLAKHMVPYLGIKVGTLPRREGRGGSVEQSFCVHIFEVFQLPLAAPLCQSLFPKLPTMALPLI